MGILQKLSQVRKPFAEVVAGKDGRISLRFMSALELKRERQRVGQDFGLFIATGWFAKLCGLLHRQGFDSIGLDLGHADEDGGIEPPREGSVPDLILTYWKNEARKPMVPTGHWQDYYVAVERDKHSYATKYKRVRKWVEPESKTAVPMPTYPGVTEAILSTCDSIRRTVRNGSEHQWERERAYEESLAEIIDENYADCMAYLQKNNPDGYAQAQKMTKLAVAKEWAQSSHGDRRSLERQSVLGRALNGRAGGLGRKILRVSRSGSIMSCRRIR